MLYSHHNKKMTTAALKVTNAIYGSDQLTTNVTKQVSELVKKDALNFKVDFNILKVPDPAPGVKKTLQVYVTFKNDPDRQHLYKKNDGEQMLITVPNLNQNEEEKKKNEPVNQFDQVLKYCVVAFFGAFLTISAYRLGSEGFKSWGTMVGIILALMTASSAFGVASSSTGVIGAVFSMIGVMFTILQFVFVVSLYDEKAIDFSYAYKNVVVPVQELTTPSIQ